MDNSFVLKIFYINKIILLSKSINIIKTISHVKLQNNSQTSSADTYKYNCCHKNSCNSYSSFVLMGQHTFSTFCIIFCIELTGQLSAYNSTSCTAALFYCEERTIVLSLCIIMEIRIDSRTQN